MMCREENLDQVDEKLDDLQTFTGKPFDDDLCLYCVPMCGPYAAMSTFKFKVKLTPGSQRKGKGSICAALSCARLITV